MLNTYQLFERFFIFDIVNGINICFCISFGVCLSIVLIFIVYIFSTEVINCWRKYPKRKPKKEGVIPDGSTFGMTKIETDVNQYRDYTTVSDRLELEPVR